MFVFYETEVSSNESCKLESVDVTLGPNWFDVPSMHTTRFLELVDAGCAQSDVRVVRVKPSCVTIAKTWVPS